jgi:hypothetical protein
MFLGKKLKQQYKIRKHQIFKANLPYISRFPIVNQFVCSVLRVKLEVTIARKVLPHPQGMTPAQFAE